MSHFSCFLIGEGIVALRCVEIPIDVGFGVRGVYSPDGSLGQLSCYSVPHAPTLEVFKHAVLAGRPDFVFSITNSLLLPAEVLACVRRAAINYHDAPLPQYAEPDATRHGR